MRTLIAAMMVLGAWPACADQKAESALATLMYGLTADDCAAKKEELSNFLSGARVHKSLAGLRAAVADCEANTSAALSDAVAKD